MSRLKYSKEQYDAITHFIGPALVVAGPGSGKTSVIVGRVNYLIKHFKINPSEILVITFSKLAAISMQQRFIQSNPDDYYPVNFGTFHSVFFSIIKQQYRFDSTSIASNKYKSNVIKNILKHKLKFDTYEQELIDSLIKRISYYKNSGLVRDIEEQNGINFELFLEIYNEYVNITRQDMKIDFEDMMLICRDLLMNNSNFRETVTKKYRFILLDEFQDINELQYETIKLMLGKEKNIFAVGDDDQSIYGFRGCNPYIMLKFETEFTNAHIVKLLCNYRSDGYIIHAGRLVVEKNNNRIEKNTFTYNLLGEKVKLYGYESREEQYNQLVNLLREYDANINENIAVLFRTHSQFSYLTDRLQKEGIRSNIKEKPFNVYDTEIFKDFCHYMRLAVSPDEYDKEDFIPIMNKPLRYINRNCVIGDKVHIQMIKAMYCDKHYMLNILNKMERDLMALSKMDIFAAFNYFRLSIGYEEYYIEKCESKEKKEKAKILFEEIKERLRGFVDINELIKHVKEYTDMINSPITHSVENTGIYIMTIHASKGLEFDRVIIPDCNDGIIPHKGSIGESQVEEERRMLYVAMTRAKSSLSLMYAKGDKDNEHVISRFLYPLLKSDCIIEY